MCTCEEGQEPSVYVERERRARKPHVCEECSNPILIGERYLRISGVWDGMGQDFATCLSCRDIRQALAAATPEQECIPAIGCLREALDALPEEEADRQRERVRQARYRALEQEREARTP